MTATSRTVADFDQLPSWLVDNLKEHADVAVNGQRWVSDGIAAIAVTGATWGLDPSRTIGEVLARNSVRSTPHRLRPAAPRLHTYTIAFDSAKPVGKAERGPNVAHYAVSMGVDGIMVALKYFAIVEYLFGAVKWYGSVPCEPVVAKVDGKIVAIVCTVRPSREVSNG